MRRLLSSIVLPFLLLGCEGDTLDVVDARVSRQGEELVVDVDLRPSSDIHGYCARIVYWKSPTERLETTTQCSPEDLDEGDLGRQTFRTTTGAGCTSFTIERAFALDEGDSFELVDAPPQRKSDLFDDAFERSCL